MKSERESRSKLRPRSREDLTKPDMQRVTDVAHVLPLVVGLRAHLTRRLQSEPFASFEALSPRLCAYAAYLSAVK